MELTERKHPRLKGYDYSKGGYYYITICSENNAYIFGSIERTHKQTDCECGFIYEVKLSPAGKIAEEQLLDLQNRYEYVTVDKYVIMPTHIHIILILSSQQAKSNPRPSLIDIICAYKSLTTRLCNKNDLIPGRKIFQSSFYEKIIRNENSYYEISKYIAGNPKNINRNLFESDKK